MSHSCNSLEMGFVSNKKQSARLLKAQKVFIILQIIAYYRQLINCQDEKLNQ